MFSDDIAISSKCETSSKLVYCSFVITYAFLIYLKLSCSSKLFIPFIYGIKYEISSFRNMSQKLNIASFKILILLDIMAT